MGYELRSDTLVGVIAVRDRSFPTRSGLAAAMTGILEQDLQLPACCYTDPEYHEEEIRTLFRSGWTAIGFASEASDPGQVVPRQLSGRSLLITRDTELRLRVFDNVCRHRSHRLVETPCDRRKLIVCPYHAWSYGLDGKLVKTPYWDGNLDSAPDPSVKQSLGLTEIRIETWYDIIFADLTGEAEPFTAYIHGLEARWGPIYPQPALRPFSSERFSLDGNWKLVAENFLDNYHLPWIHPQVGKSIESALGLDAENLQPAQHIIGFSLAGSGEAKKKTALPLPCWPALDADRQLRQDLFFLFPNVCLVMEGSYLWSMVLLPTSAESCDELVSLYVAGDDAMSSQHRQSREELADTIYEINRQDNEVIRNLQAGRRGNPFATGHFNPHHDQLGIWFHRHVARMMTNR